MSKDKPLRDISTFTQNMRSAMEALYGEQQPMRLHQLAAKIDQPAIEPTHLISPMQVLRRGGYVRRIKKLVGERQIGHRTFPVHETTYVLTDAGREAWRVHVNSTMCNHDFIEHVSHGNRPAGDKICVLCGLEMRVEEEPDEQELSSLTTHQTLDALAHAKQISLSRTIKRPKAWYCRMFDAIKAAFKEAA